MVLLVDELDEICDCFCWCSWPRDLGSGLCHDCLNDDHLDVNGEPYSEIERLGIERFKEHDGPILPEYSS